MELFEKKRRKPIINLTPLIDILFILIIFFGASAKLIEEGGGIGILLPESQQAPAASLTFPVLSVNEQQQIWLNQVQTAPEELMPQLQKLLNHTPSKTLIFNVDKRVPHGMVIRLMDQAKLQGFRKIVFGTQPAA